MKWYEVSVGHGDGTYGVERFKTKKEAQAWRDKQEEDPYFECDGDGSPVNEVDTASKWFWHTEDE